MRSFKKIADVLSRFLPVPLESNYIRAELLFSGVIVEPLSENLSRVLSVHAFDPRGERFRVLKD